MNQRKLIRLGNSSFAVALPKTWVDKAGLKKGDNVFLEENGNGELIVQSSFNKPDEGTKSEINVKNKDLQTLRREISSNYVRGDSVFSIKGKRTREINAEIKKIIGELLGMEIIKSDTEEMLIKDIFNIEEINITNFIRRIDNNLREMLNILSDAITKKKISKTQLADIDSADSDINKFQLLISRIFFMGAGNPAILTKLKLNSLNLINNWWLSFNLEHIGDELKAMSKLLKNNSLLDKEYETLKSILPKLQEIYIASLESFHTKDFEKNKALEIITRGKHIWAELDKLTLNKSPALARIAMRLKEIETYSYQNLKMAINNII